MEIRLICSDNKRQVLFELLSARNIAIRDDAGICIVESGFPQPQDKLCIVFHANDIFTMMQLFDKDAEGGGGTHSIVGRTPNDKYVVIPLRQINCFESRGNTTYCLVKEGEYRVKEKLYTLEGKLPQDRFIRVGKSFIVNIANVTEIIPWFGRRLLLKFIDCKDTVEVSRNYVRNVKEFLGI